MIYIYINIERWGFLGLMVLQLFVYFDVDFRKCFSNRLMQYFGESFRFSCSWFSANLGPSFDLLTEKVWKILD